MTGLAMAFDFGTTKIGVAVGQKITGTATPVAVVKARDGIPQWLVIDRLVEEWQPTVLVVGLPINMDGTESDMSKAATRFSRRLNGRYGISIELMDERLTTFEAREFETPDQLDAIAAKLILETWLADST
ncbi:MAG: Holliday junction resolvase RuvX [Gammaproteobacteria bacterium]|jgi:putative Holliday junction resolvase|nr:Holliday junction resolvase RuvX [Gammaproteobacteria bacterium]MBT3866577.1 Holliday junction resolvase RuvX [Gammaproteobacteria bacterium]MBT4377990.1 Holliday junction resolvase RuvX [Gammaproteobacteria bacterium]MBT5199944.1 Holliday junction resolvase RuvX [Gammaproteobacteria bacterium]MBT5444817.1 Holliday junction resolvase RuvX [Gammaproteobacteria bacterium]